MKVTALLACTAPTFASWAIALPSGESALEERRSASSWFLPNLDHTSAPVRGYVPNLPTYDYPVYKSVKSGDSQGLLNAITSDGPSGNRNNCWLAGQPRVIYLAPGTYTLSSTLYMYTDTVIIGDASNPPVIKASSGFNGDYLIVGGQGDGSDRPCGGFGGETHFSIMFKNVILDTTSNAGKTGFTALSWAVAQNCALVNVKINMPQGAHTGMVMGPGSTISVSDVHFTYGNVGLHWAGHQQGQLKGMSFDKCTTGILIDGGNTISILAPSCNTVGNCIVLNSGNPWVAVIDGQNTNSGDFFTSKVQYPNFMLENISNNNGQINLVTVGGNAKVGGKNSLGAYIYGNTRGANPIYQTNPTEKAPNRPAALAPGGKYPSLSAPQYADKKISDVINLKDVNQNGGFNLHGDGNVDDTQALQGALNTAASKGKIAYLPFGVYKVTSTVTIPPGTELYGEAWSTISGSGNAFASASNPTPVVQIGSTPGQKGTARVQDIRFTVHEALAGAILLRINMAGNSPGDVAVFNSLNTIGGTRDTDIDCSDESNCKAAYLGVHLAAGSSAYIDNFWSWVADHSVDDSGKGIRAAVKGGVLVESTVGTWLAGFGSEHYWLYQASYHNAANVFVGMFQSETNYNQATHGAPLNPQPFSTTSSDPDFSWCGGGDSTCRMSLGQFYSGSNKAVYHYAAGSWNFKSLTGIDQGIMNVIRDIVSDAHLHGFTTGPNVKKIMRLPNGNQFGNGGNDGYGGSWETLVADIASQS
ncbi:hypothetical protein MY10362_001148 [Beauveria mimosiformis]